MKTNPTLIPTDGLVLDMPLDGDAKARVGTDGTATNVTWETSAKGFTSEAGVFNGSTAYVNTNAKLLAGLSAVTVSLYIKHGNTGVLAEIVGDNTNVIGTKSWYITHAGHYATPAINFGVGNGITGVGASVIAISDNEYHHYIFDREINEFCRIYRDGELVATGTTTMSTNIASSPSHNSRIGSTQYYTTRDFAGGVGGLKIYNRRLNSSERQSLNHEFNRKFGPTNLLPTYTTSLSPTAYYPLNGDTLDYAGSNDGTPTAITYSGVWGGEGGEFNGSTSKISLGTSTTLFDKDTYTYSLWVKNHSFTANNRVIAYSGVNLTKGRKFLIQQVNYLQFDNGGGDNCITGTLNTNEWYHIVMTCNSYSMELFVNGVSVDTSTGGTGETGSPATATFYLGATRSGVAHFDGELALFSYFSDEVLTQSQITTLYNEGAKWVVGNKYSLPNLEEGKVLDISKKAVGGVYYDQTGNNNGTPTNVVDSAKGLNNSMLFNTGGTSYIGFGTGDIGWGGDLTVSLWFNPSSLSGYDTLIGDWTGTGANFFLDASDNSGVLVAKSGNGSTLGDPTYLTYTLTVGKMQHICYTRSGTTKVLYIDGIQQSTYTSGYSGGITTNFKSLGYSSSGSNSCSGDIIAPRVYNRALSSNEVAQLYNSNFIQND